MTRSIEPGILPLFRLFVGLEIFLLMLRMGLERVFRADFPIVGSPWTGMVLLTLLFGYLSWSYLERQMGRIYLPIGLILSAGMTLMGAASGMTMRAETGIRAEELVRGSWVLIVVLLVPLILVAWQYGFRWAVWFCLLTAAAELTLTLAIAANGERLPLVLVGIAVVRCLLFLPVGYAVGQLADAERRQRDALSEANARLARYASTLEQLAEHRERNRLAHELHDTLAHGLSSIAVQLEAISALWKPQPQTARAMLSDALTTTRTALSEARRAIAALRASPLEEMGLAKALRQLAESTASREGLKLDMQIPSCLGGLNTQTEHAMYRIAAEALANVVRHAEARCLTVRVEDSLSGVSLLVTDDGRGFDAAPLSEEGQFGLSGMRERARMMGADFAVESARGAGTTIRLAVQRNNNDTRFDL